ncbi:DNA-binding protein, partial [Vibrio cholerae]
MWLIASELAGVVGLPTSDRNVREQMKKLAAEKPELARKRQGSKAMEYHISLLPPSTQAALLKKTGKVKVGEQVINLPKA